MLPPQTQTPEALHSNEPEAATGQSSESEQHKSVAMQRPSAAQGLVFAGQAEGFFLRFFFFRLASAGSGSGLPESAARRAAAAAVRTLRRDEIAKARLRSSKRE